MTTPATQSSPSISEYAYLYDMDWTEATATGLGYSPQQQQQQQQQQEQHYSLLAQDMHIHIHTHTHIHTNTHLHTIPTLPSASTSTCTSPTSGISTGRNTTTQDVNDPNHMHIVTDEMTTTVTASTRIAAQEGMARAQAILLKFQSSNNISNISNISNNNNNNNISFNSEPFQHSNSYDYKQRRDMDLKREQERLNQALVRNWEYLAKREEIRLRQQLLQIDQAKVLEQHQDQNSMMQTKIQMSMQQQQQQQQQQLLSAGRSIASSRHAGIGTLSQRNRKHKVSQLQREHKHNDTSSPALYISNLSLTSCVNVIRNLFEAYGKVKKVHFYTHKQTGELKGDGLVVYESNKDHFNLDFLQSICQQLNGCELPCQSILHVEPAKRHNDICITPQQREEDMTVPTDGTMHTTGTTSFDPTSSTTTKIVSRDPLVVVTNSETVQSTDTTTTTTMAATLNVNLNGEHNSTNNDDDDDDDDDDLDDFFASLT